MMYSTLPLHVVSDTQAVTYDPFTLDLSILTFPLSLQFCKALLKPDVFAETGIKIVRLTDNCHMDIAITVCLPFQGMIKQEQ